MSCNAVNAGARSPVPTTGALPSISMVRMQDAEAMPSGVFLHQKTRIGAGRVARSLARSVVHPVGRAGKLRLRRRQPNGKHELQ
eukprot:7595310-Pyramimonas_sp.AAC.1